VYTFGLVKILQSLHLNMRSFLSKVNKEYASIIQAGLFVIFVVVVGIFAFSHLTESPPTWYDEGMILQLAENLAQHGVMGMQVAPGGFVSASHVSTGYPIVVPVALSFKVFGIGILSARSVAVGYMFLLLGVGFLFLSKMYGKTLAFWGVLLVASFSSFYGDGKNVLGEVPGLALFLCFLFFLERFIQGSFLKRGDALFAGIFLGLTIATKPTFLPILPALLLALVYNRHAIIWKKEWVIAGVAGVVFPIGIWILTQFGSNDSWSEVLRFYANPYNLTGIPEVMRHNMLRFFTESTPVYTLATFLIWAVAFGIRNQKKLIEHITTSELCAFFFTTLVLLAFLRTPGWYRYLFIANVLILLFLPSAIATVVRYVSERISWSSLKVDVASYGATILLCVLFVFQAHHLIFDSWISNTTAYRRTERLSAYFNALPPQDVVCVYNAPEVVPFIKTKEYYQYFSGVWTAGEGSLLQIKNNVPDIVVASEDAVPEVRALSVAYEEIDEVGGKYIILGRKHSL